MTKDFHIIIDFDSTFVKIESLEKLAEIALNNRPDKNAVLEEISRITAQGMEGKIPFSRSLEKRLELFSFNKNHLRRLVTDLKKTVTESIRENKDFILSNKNNIYIISGGFEDYIWPTVREYGIKKPHVLANKFIFDNRGVVVGFDRQSALSSDYGKALAVNELALKGPVFVIGDGYTDYEIKKSGIPCRFFAFTENVRRERVIAKADFVVDDFNQFIYIINQL